MGYHEAFLHDDKTKRELRKLIWRFKQKLKL